MSKLYTIFGEEQTLGTGNVLAAFQTNSGVLAGSQVAIRQIDIGQHDTTTAAMIRAAMSTRDTAGTLTMTAFTPRAFSPVTGPASTLSGNTAPAGGVARVGINSSADSGGAYTDHYVMNFSNLNGFGWAPTLPGGEIIVPPSTVWCLRLLATPGTATGWSWCIIIEELT